MSESMGEEVVLRHEVYSGIALKQLPDQVSTYYLIHELLEHGREHGEPFELTDAEGVAEVRGLVDAAVGHFWAVVTARAIESHLKGHLRGGLPEEIPAECYRVALHQARHLFNRTLLDEMEKADAFEMDDIPF